MLALPSERGRFFLRFGLILLVTPAQLPLNKQRARYATLKAARDRALVHVLAYTAVRVRELLRDPNDAHRRGIHWEDLSLDDGSMDVYRKKQQWDAASLPDPVINGAIRELAKEGHGDQGANPEYDVAEIKQARDEMLDDE